MVSGTAAVGALLLVVTSGIFDWKQRQWKWGDSGKPLKTVAISKTSEKAESYRWHCVIIDPKRGNKFGADKCISSNQYICETDAKAYVEFKLFSKTINRRITIAKCTSGEDLTEHQRKKCRKLLGNDYGKDDGMHVCQAKQDTSMVKYRFICPDEFNPIGKKCYYFSNDSATWFDSRQQCNNLNNSTLGILSTPSQEKGLRNYLNKNGTGSSGNSYWIGGIFDWKQRQWKWGDSGKPLKTVAISKTSEKAESYRWHCVIIDPKRGNKFGADKCISSNQYICETDAKAYVEFKLFSKTINRRITIAKCTSGEDLTEHQRKKCRKLLGNDYGKDDGSKHPNEPASLIQMNDPKPTKPTKMRNNLYICPQNMISLGNKCYIFSKDNSTWNEAHFNCRGLNARLAVVASKAQDHTLRRFLNGFIRDNNERWIGGRYDWESGQWKWAMTGKPLKYKGFAKNILKNRTNESLKWHTIVMDPQLNNAWNTRSEFERKHYICEVKAKRVKRFTGLRRPDATITITH